MTENVARLPNVEVEPYFVAINDEAMRGETLVENGTARILQGGPASLRSRTLAKILTAHPHYSAAAFIKIDTDGFDVPILLANMALLEARKPTVFFEYAPSLFQVGEEEGFGLFQKLNDIGYGRVIFYDNAGDYLLTMSLDDDRALRDLHEYMVGRTTARYWDIVAFSKADADLATSVREAELVVAREARASAAVAKQAGAQLHPFPASIARLSTPLEARPHVGLSK